MLSFHHCAPPSSQPAAHHDLCFVFCKVRAHLSDLVCPTTPMSYIKWYHLILHVLFHFFSLSPLWSGKSQRREAEEVWWGWRDSPIGVQIKTCHGTLLAMVHTCSTSSCLHIMLCPASPRDAWGHLCPVQILPLKTLNPSSVLSIVGPLQGDFLNINHVVIKFPTISGVSVGNSAWQRSLTLKSRKNYSGIIFFLTVMWIKASWMI